MNRLPGNCKEIIIAHMNADGPQTHNQLKEECRLQAIPYNYRIFDAALSALLSEGRIVVEVMNEDSTPYRVYDFPDSYYEGTS